MKNKDLVWLSVMGLLHAWHCFKRAKEMDRHEAELKEKEFYIFKGLRNEASRLWSVGAMKLYDPKTGEEADIGYFSKVLKDLKDGKE